MPYRGRIRATVTTPCPLLNGRHPRPVNANKPCVTVKSIALGGCGGPRVVAPRGPSRPRGHPVSTRAGRAPGVPGDTMTIELEVSVLSDRLRVAHSSGSFILVHPAHPRAGDRTSPESRSPSLH